MPLQRFFRPLMINLRAVTQLHVTGPSNLRYVSSVALSKRQTRKIFNISTLDPQRLVASDFINIEDRKFFTVAYRKFGLIYRRYERIHGLHQPFPTGTHGYLYLHHIPDVHRAASTIRFRICDKDLPPLESFSRGRDLLLTSGIPWQINMWQLMDRYRNENMLQCLLLDKVLSAEVLQQLDKFERLMKRDVRFQLHSLHIISFRQQFNAMTNQRYIKRAFVDLDDCTFVRITAELPIMKYMPDLQAEGRRFTMCLEYDPHGGSAKNSIVLRVLQIPQELRGKTRYNEGDIMPFIPFGLQFERLLPKLLDVLLQQSPSLSSQSRSQSSPLTLPRESSA